MAVLKTIHKVFSRDYRVKGSTLMETLVATVLIVLIFMLASMILNNLFSNTIKNNNQAIKTHLNELQYLQQNEQLRLPYVETFQNWNVTIESYKENSQSYIEFEAINSKTNKNLSIVKVENQ
ncbi:type II secretion system protein J [Winogradskyella sp. MIT101101]|uniref:PulJ/GspJ family protein n=1 Tax=Winogradskyella sp. MIT101101 TaxID=3098297 RepID=UPI00399BDC06